MPHPTLLPAPRLFRHAAAAASTTSDQASHEGSAKDKDGVIWFSESARLVRGQPDTRYGWLDTPDGPCIVKALNHELVAYADTLLAHERFMLRCMAERGAPVCEWVPRAREGWLITRFAGLSLRRLGQPCLMADGSRRPALRPLEHLSAWAHLLQRMAPMAAQGILMVDLHDGNVTLPLLQGHGLAGQLSLQRPCLIDQAHSLVSEAPLRRPLLIEPDSFYIAPELRPALRQDHARLRAHFHDHGYTRLPQARDDLCARLWADYDAPQATLALVQSGEICAGRAMQYAAGSALAPHIGDAILAGAHPQLREVIDTMLAVDPRQRHRDPGAAAQALMACLPALPKVGHASLAKVVPAELVARQQAAASSVFVRDGAGHPCTQDGPATVQIRPEGEAGLACLLAGSSPWAYWAVAAGAALGTILGGR